MCVCVCVYIYIYYSDWLGHLIHENTVL